MRTVYRLCRRKGTFLILFFLALLLCSCLRDGDTGNQSARPTLTPKSRSPLECVGNVTEVTYDVWSGPISMPYTEEYVISETGVRLTRTGTSGSAPPGQKFNAGTWEFDVDPEDVARLFEQLQAVDWASIVALSQEEPAPIGGGTALYKVTCEGDSSAALWYGEGRRYINGRVVADPIEKFIVNLRLPDNASLTVPVDDPE